MVFLLWNILLALAWMLAVGGVSLSSLGIGLLLGYAILWLSQPAIGRSSYFGRVRRTVYFLLFFLWELVLANLRVAHDVITPRYYMRPAIIPVPLDAKTDLEITLLANLITLTPGTLSLDVSEDRRVMHVHAMFADDAEVFRKRIKNGFERRLLEILR